MPKKIKLNLNDLKVQSFVTMLDGTEKEKMKGGSDETISYAGTNCWPACNSHSICASGIICEDC